MSLEDKINEALKSAIKQQDAIGLRALRAIKAEILLVKTSGKGGTVSPSDEISLLQKMIKQRKESLGIFEKEGRKDLQAKEQEEIDIIQKFLPEQLTPAELEKIINNVITESGATSIKDMGKVMGLASKIIAGRAENQILAQLIKSKLS